MIPHERISGDYRQNKHDLRSKLSHSSPSPSLGVTESLPSTSSGNASNIHNDQFNAYSPYWSKKRPASSSHTVSSKRLQTSVPIPRPIQRMTLEQIGLIQGRVICTLDSIDSIKSLKRSPQHIFVEVRVPVPGFQVQESNFRVPSSGLRTLFHG
ncbi:hypothetical protein Avbf_18240 [Armadillidium vulgare]|nr:hypothetical protein Avbf_18240 [Armadillidium vulgare]